MGNGTLPHGPSYRAHPRLYLTFGLMHRSKRCRRFSPLDLRTVRRQVRAGYAPKHLLAVPIDEEFQQWRKTVGR
jgi:hypothetical protein